MRKVINSRPGMRGWLSARIKKAGTTEWIPLWEIPVKNLITAVGLAQLALLAGDDGADAFDYAAIGSGTTAAAVPDTTLQTEEDRVAAVFSRETTVYSNDTGKWVSTHTGPVGGWSITEFGILTAASGGVLYNRVVFSAISVAETDELEFTYKSQMTAL